MPISESISGDVTKNGKATISLVLGIIGLLAWFIPIAGVPITIIGLIFGIKGLKAAKRGIAMAGLVLSIIGLLATIVNASIGAYQGATGQNYLINKFLNQDGQELENGTRPTQQQTTPQSSIPGTLEKQAYSNVQHSFKINAPKGWRVDESGQFGTIVFFLNTETDREGENNFSANINATSESTQGYDLDGYVGATKDLLPKLLQNYKSTDNRRVTANGMPAQIIGGTFAQGAFHLRNLQLIVVKNEQAYVVTGTVLESTWDQYKDLIESSLLTFAIN